MPVKPVNSARTPEAQLRSFIERFAQKDQKFFRSLRTAVRKRLPGANELAYNYADSVVVSYSPSERGIEGVVSISMRADDMRLYLMNGPQLHDPKKLLRGTGKQTRFVQLLAASDLANPDVEALIAAAIDHAQVPLPATGKGKLFIRSGADK